VEVTIIKNKFQKLQLSIFNYLLPGITMIYTMFNSFKFDVIMFENELKNVYDT